MTAKEYLMQAYRLDNRIKLDTEEYRTIREMAQGLSAVRYDNDTTHSNTPSDASFVKALNQLWELEQKLNEELCLLSALKLQIRDVIDTVKDPNERLVLSYRYMQEMKWEQIAQEMSADAKTIRRWHGDALSHVVMPKKPVQI